MKFTATVQERDKGGKKQKGYLQRFIFLPQTAPFTKGEKIDVKVSKHD